MFCGLRLYRRGEREKSDGDFYVLNLCRWLDDFGSFFLESFHVELDRGSHSGERLINGCPSGHTTGKIRAVGGIILPRFFYYNRIPIHFLSSHILNPLLLIMNQPSCSIIFMTSLTFIIWQRPG